jgi:hypothetical protein
MQGARVLAVFGSAERAEAAVNCLRGAGFEFGRLSVIGKDDGTFCAGRFPFWTRLGPALAGVAVVSVARVGPVVALGPIVRRASTNDVRNPPSGRFSALAAMLMRAGISAGAARTYEAAVRGGQIVVLVHGTAKDALKARSLLRGRQAKAPMAAGR